MYYVIFLAKLGKKILEIHIKISKEYIFYVILEKRYVK